MHALAWVLRTSTAALEATISAAEFMRWQAWMVAEQVGPAWDRLRHAEVLAAIHNGACQRKGGGNFTAADFLPQRPHSEVPQDAARHAALLNAELAALESSFAP